MAASLVSTASKKGGGVGSLDKAAMLGFDLSVCELQARHGTSRHCGRRYALTALRTTLALCA